MHAGTAGVVTGDVRPGERAGVFTAWGKLFIRRGGECFYRARRVTTLEPQHTQGAVRGSEGGRDGERERTGGSKIKTDTNRERETHTEVGGTQKERQGEKEEK